MVEKGGTTTNDAEYNALGRFILGRRGTRSISEIAKGGGIDRSKLNRTMRGPLKQIPEVQVLQGIAQGLDVPLATVNRFAIEAWGQDATSPDLMAEYAQLWALIGQLSRGELLLLMDHAEQMVQIRTAANPAKYLQPRSENAHHE